MEINIESITNDYLKKMEDEGFFNKLIEENIHKTITSAIENCFDSWSLKKKIEERIEKEFIGKFDGIGLSAYSNFIENSITNIINEHIKGELADKLNNNIKNLLLRKREYINLSEIVKEYIEYIRCKYEDIYMYKEDIEKYDNLISISIEKDYSFDWYNIVFKLGNFSSYRSYNTSSLNEDECLKLTLRHSSKENDNVYKILSAKYNGLDMGSINIKGYLSDFEALVINTAMNETKVIVDIENIEEAYTINEDYEGDIYD